MKRAILILTLAGSFFGCSPEDVLNKPLLDELSEETYWNSATDLRLFINQFYTSLRGNNTFYNLDSDSDNLKPANPSRVLEGSRGIPSSGGGWYWGNIRELNYFLENAPEAVPGTGGTQAELDHFLGEGYFFRARYYFTLLRDFGDLPIYNKVLNVDSEELYASREPRNEVVDFIIEDLNKAIELMQEKGEVPVGRLTKGAALLLKSRVALYEGTWEKYHAGGPFGVDGSNGENYLQMAVSAAETLIDNGNYEIYSTGNPEEDYYNLFSSDDLSGNEEVILFQEVDPSLNLGTGQWVYLNGLRGGATGVTKELVDDYLAMDGLPISISDRYEGDSTLTQTVENRDPRLEQTIWTPGQVQLNTQPDPVIFEVPTLDEGSSSLATTGYMIRKGSTTDPEQNTGSSTDNYGKTDVIVYRYAEALLNFAEAKAELGTITQEDLDKSINVLRERVGLPPLEINVGFTDPSWDFPDLSPIINEIRRERRIELALEGFRFDDLMRWAAADEIIQGERWKGARFIEGVSFPSIESRLGGIPLDEQNYIDRYQNALPNGFEFDENRDYLSPIPTDELSLNENLEQNPGW